MSDKHEDANDKIIRLNNKLSEHDTQIATIQSLTTLGFIIALITLAGVVIASVAFVWDQVHQTNTQTQLLQQINDKVNE